MFYVLKAWTNFHDTISAFCDPTKPFEYVHHGLRLDKLWYPGLQKSVLDSICSYPTNREQKVTNKEQHCPCVPLYEYVWVYLKNLNRDRCLS